MHAKAISFDDIATLTAYIFITNLMYITGQVGCLLQWVSYNVSKCHELWPTNGLNWTAVFTHPL